MTSIAEAKFRILEIAHQRKVVGLPADGDGAGPPHPANETEEMWLVRRRAAQCLIEALVSRRSVQVKLPRAYARERHQRPKARAAASTSHRGKRPPSSPAPEPNRIGLGGREASRVQKEPERTAECTNDDERHREVHHERPHGALRTSRAWTRKPSRLPLKRTITQPASAGSLGT
jgi:hypothetical protein